MVVVDRAAILIKHHADEGCESHHRKGRFIHHQRQRIAALTEMVVDLGRLGLDLQLNAVGDFRKTCIAVRIVGRK